MIQASVQVKFIKGLLCRWFGHPRVVVDIRCHDSFVCSRCRKSWPVSGGWPPTQLPVPPYPPPSPPRPAPPPPAPKRP